jgi:hypothetical protein
MSDRAEELYQELERCVDPAKYDVIVKAIGDLNKAERLAANQARLKAEAAEKRRLADREKQRSGMAR